jgi:hypothetical protein
MWKTTPLFQSKYHFMAKWTVCLLLIFTLILGSGCTITRTQEVKKGAAEIRQNLYTPADAILLNEVERSDALAYGSGCSGVVVEMVYGVNRPLNNVIEEYHSSLLASGWELDPAYSPNKTNQVAFYRKGPEVAIQIDSTPVWASLPSQEKKDQQYKTLYTILIVYTIPSNAECVG